MHGMVVVVMLYVDNVLQLIQQLMLLEMGVREGDHQMIQEEVWVWT